jgi:SnoaL-like domain
MSLDPEALRYRLIDAMNRRDLHALRKITHPQCEFLPPTANSEGHVYRGSEAFVEFLANIEAAPDELAWEVDEAVPLPDGRLLLMRALLPPCASRQSEGLPRAGT